MLVLLSLVIFLIFTSVKVEDTVIYLDDKVVESTASQNTSSFLPQYIVELNKSVAYYSEYYDGLLKDAQDINEDVIGWIDIEDFNISYPVLFSEDNKEYLRKNIEGNYDVSGAIYMDANYDDVLSPVKLIHGHNMKNGKMFSNIPQMLWWKTLDDAPIIIYYDETGLKRYKIFSIYSVNVKEESVIVNEYQSMAEVLSLKEFYVNRSQVPISEVPSGTELLMLNTCWYGLSGSEHNLHCIVVAVRI